jgi:hypothetical protein
MIGDLPAKLIRPPPGSIRAAFVPIREISVKPFTASGAVAQFRPLGILPRMCDHQHPQRYTALRRCRSPALRVATGHGCHSIYTAETQSSQRMQRQEKTDSAVSVPLRCYMVQLSPLDARRSPQHQWHWPFQVPNGAKQCQTVPYPQGGRNPDRNPLCNPPGALRSGKFAIFNSQTCYAIASPPTA